MATAGFACGEERKDIVHANPQYTETNTSEEERAKCE